MRREATPAGSLWKAWLSAGLAFALLIAASGQQQPHTVVASSYSQLLGALTGAPAGGWAAGAATTIQLSGVISVTASIPVTAPVVLQGAADNSTQLDCGGRSISALRILLSSNGTVTVRNVRFSNCNDTALVINSTGVGTWVLLDSCTFSGNTGSVAGAVWSYGTSLTVKSCQFHTNTCWQTLGSSSSSSSSHVEGAGALFWEFGGADGWDSAVLNIADSAFTASGSLGPATYGSAVKASCLNNTNSSSPSTGTYTDSYYHTSCTSSLVRTTFDANLGGAFSSACCPLCACHYVWDSSTVSGHRARDYGTDVGDEVFWWSTVVLKLGNATGSATLIDSNFTSNEMGALSVVGPDDAEVVGPSTSSSAEYQSRLLAVSMAGCRFDNNSKHRFNQTCRGAAMLVQVGVGRGRMIRAVGGGARSCWCWWVRVRS